MADKDDIERKDATERRVYNLPADLLERLRAYQIGQGIASEAEAARRLLDTALQMRDTVTDILNTLETKYGNERDLRVLASEVLVKHILVSKISFEDGELVFSLTNSERGKLTGSGAMYYSTVPFGDDDWSSHRRKPSNHPVTRKAISAPSWEPSKGGDLDDEIPF